MDGKSTLGAGSGAEDTVAASFKDFLTALWKKYNLGEDADEDVIAELRKVLKAQYLQHISGGESADAFADDAIALMRRIWEQYDPDGQTGMAIIAEIQTR